jgi:hypothetical protein
MILEKVSGSITKGVTEMMFRFFGLASVIMSISIVSVYAEYADSNHLPLKKQSLAESCISLDVPVRTDMRYAVELGVRFLTSTFNSDNNDRPWKFTLVQKDGKGELADDSASGISHNVGRCIWGGMLAEETMGVSFPEKGYSILLRQFRASFDNNDCVNAYVDSEQGGAVCMAGHNLREGLYGLVGLIRTRNSDWARQTAAKMVATLESITTEDGHLSPELAQSKMSVKLLGLGSDVTTSGRLIEPLVAYYKLTGDVKSLELAGKYAKATLASVFTEDGDIGPLKGWDAHIHSICSSLAGIAAYAQETKNEKLLSRCGQIVDRGIAKYSTKWGWVDELMPSHPVDEHLRGEINQTADVVRIALILGNSGQPKYYELAEQYIRGVLLHAQHRQPDISKFMHQSQNPVGDKEKAVVERSIGGYGMILPNDRMKEGAWPVSVLDITSGAIHGLCEAWKYRVTEDANAINVNLLFDTVHPCIEVKSFLPFQGRIECFVKKSKKLRIRIPSWVDIKTVEVEIEGQKVKDIVKISCGYLECPGSVAGRTIICNFNLKVRTEKEIVEGEEYTATWCGDQIIQILPRGKVSPMPF